MRIFPGPDSKEFLVFVVADMLFPAFLVIRSEFNYSFYQYDCLSHRKRTKDKEEFSVDASAVFALVAEQKTGLRDDNG